MDTTDELHEVRAAYDEVASSYVELVVPIFEALGYDLAVLGWFAASVAGRGPVADLGCGPGHVTDFLAQRDVDAHGLDLSRGMIGVARSRYPGLGFAVGDLTATGLPDASQAGVLAWYSIIHTPPSRFPVLFNEFRRIARPGAPMLLAFQLGEGAERRTGAYGHDVSYVVRRHCLDTVLTAAQAAGLDRDWVTVAEPSGAQRLQQAIVALHRPV